MVLKNPDNFLRLFLFSIIIGIGPKIYGYPLIDEYWLVMLLFGLSIRKMMIGNVVIDRLEKKKYNLHEKIFIFLTLYYLFQCFRGGIWLEDLRMLRWIIFFIIIGVTFLFLSNYKKNIDAEYVTKFTIYACTIYFFLYFLSGYSYELFTGKSKNDLQHTYIAGTSVANFVSIIYVIALIIYNQRNNKTISNINNANIFIFFSFIIVTFVVVYYDSRSGIFTILGALSLNYLFQILNRNKKGIFQFFLIIFFITSYQIWATNYSENRSIQDFLPVDSELNLVIPQSLAEQNVGSGRARLLEPKVAVNFITEDVIHALFGYGWYMSRFELVEPIDNMRKREQLKRLKMERLGSLQTNAYQASSAVAILVDTGFIGVFLYLLNLLLGFRSILKSQNNSKYVVSILYITIILWTLVGTLSPVLLIYFWVMPKNPILLMLEQKKEKL